MVNITNSDEIQAMQRAGRLQSIEGLPTSLQGYIQPVMETNPALLRRPVIVRVATATNATSSTAYTTDSAKDTYLVACTLSVVKDVTATSTSSTIALTPFGDNTQRQILNIAGVTLTAQDQIETLSLPFPLKLARGSTIQVTNGTNVANVIAKCSVILYEVTADTEGI